ncbi:MAG TPA: hypothetical protein VLC98_12820 [Phnomibacter sp.]|nr:hypothetical protein [Phnomibacter sp.]
MEPQQQLAHIQKFIDSQTVASICCTNGNGELHCFSCYYAFDSNVNLLYFKTNDNTLHMQWMEEWTHIAGTILPDKQKKVLVKGIQLNGKLLPTDDPLVQQATKIYHLRFPFTLAMKGKVHAIRLDKIKMTDNSLGFGTKLLWERVTPMHIAE